ncbi:hypothetical protein BV98_001015 [Sphingobium herbicidovorans NBRC 16415]|jgi:hypothetical protein|uniref:Uncharacterized protein n=1 Tax=Sphingobium herbicidovorans (strain ATCC 700291 / DSM 11019 / CCUG 56400 / KCTC 2939 / LMG 18315 / NBRC 16415 / MH) TaxID=1219045 RepID=A0A086PCY7_SPHHM|nr:hypothetical protein [Sphingobium herbicidovorans]KFG91255.1 hypothetical protein BV98_001015 [Sphingobium herbicidovorans NBRC 16415]
MGESKPLASLTSGLLARKGAAQPAMRRPVMGFGGQATATLLQDDLGWNDMGFDVTEPEPVPAEPRAVVGLTPMTQPPVAAPVPPVVVARKELTERMEEAVKTIAPATQPVKGRKAAFTLRLDADRHLKLRLASAVVGRSAQQMVTEALDIFLASLPDIDRLAQQLPRGEAK